MSDSESNNVVEYKSQLVWRGERVINGLIIGEELITEDGCSCYLLNNHKDNPADLLCVVPNEIIRCPLGTEFMIRIKKMNKINIITKIYKINKSYESYCETCSIMDDRKFNSLAQVIKFSKSIQEAVELKQFTLIIPEEKFSSKFSLNDLVNGISLPDLFGFFFRCNQCRAEYSFSGDFYHGNVFWSKIKL